NAEANTISVLLGNGDGSLQAQVTYATGSFPSSVAIGDLNGDGKPDLVVGNQVAGTISVLLGNGDGTFHPQSTYTGTGANTFIALGDLNGDGRPALVTDAVSVLLNDFPPILDGPVYTIDRTAPAAPLITSIVEDIGFSDGDALFGTAEANSTVTVFDGPAP